MTSETGLIAVFSLASVLAYPSEEAIQDSIAYNDVAFPEDPTRYSLCFDQAFDLLLSWEVKVKAKNAKEENEAWIQIGKCSRDCSNYHTLLTVYDAGDIVLAVRSADNLRTLTFNFYRPVFAGGCNRV
ncbi:MAG: hypothetical protein FWD52_04590 [Candidatus Bathyarchaeota archaeon]|nr:hypothetical protein [Candidatus Termiticorpusculum sp.]